MAGIAGPGQEYPEKVEYKKQDPREVEYKDQESGSQLSRIVKLEQKLNDNEFWMEGVFTDGYYGGDGIVLACETRLAYKVYVTWEFDEEGNLFWGHYFDLQPTPGLGDRSHQNQQDAIRDFRDRIRARIR